MTSYDEIIYPGAPVVLTQPSRMGAAAAVFGLDYAPPETARVLEIAAGDGANLIPLAAAWPQARFFGFDIAATRVEAGQARISALGLDNIRLETLDLLEAGEIGEFDYVIAHGLYAWTPPAVRDGLMRLIGRVLSPRGVAFVSYNTLPGSRLRQTVREMMLRRLEGVTEPRERLAQAVIFLRALVETLDEKQPHQAAIRRHAEVMLKRPPEQFFHDELNEFYEPAYVADFVAHAGRHGLQYLCEAEPFRIEPALPANDHVRAIAAEAGGDTLRLQQLADLFGVETFRQTLLRRGERPLDLRLALSALQRLHAASPIERDPEVADGWRTPVGAKLHTREPVLVQLFEALAARWPATLPLAGFDLEVLQKVLQLHLLDMVELHAAPSPFDVEPSERPRAFSVARRQIADGEPKVTALAHRQVELRDEGGRLFIGLLDGTRTRPELAQALADKLGAPVEQVAATLDQHLRALGRMALLEG